MKICFNQTKHMWLTCSDLPICHELTWPDLTWLDLTWLDLSWADLTWPEVTWPDLTWPDLTLPGLAWPDLAWSDLTWPGLAWPDMYRHVSGKISHFCQHCGQRDRQREGVRRWSIGPQPEASAKKMGQVKSKSKKSDSNQEGKTHRKRKIFKVGGKIVEEINKADGKEITQPSTSTP